MRGIMISLSACLFLGCAEYKEWKTYQYKEFGFAVDMPEEPKKRIKDVPGDDFEYHLFTYKSNHEGLDHTSYAVFYVDLKDNVNSSDSASIEHYFEYLDQETKAKNPSKILNKRRFEVQGYPAVEHVMEFANGDQYMITQDLLVNNKSYQIVMVCPSKLKDNPENARFIESFKLTSQ